MKPSKLNLLSALQKLHLEQEQRGSQKSEDELMLRLVKALESMGKIETMKGEKGDMGPRGFMPIKGKDYFTRQEILEFIDIVTPVKGRDYFDGEKGKDGKDGTDGKDGIDGIDGVANMDEVIGMIIDKQKEHMKECDHKLLHKPTDLGGYELAVESLQDGDYLQVKDKKIIGVKMPKQTAAVSHSVSSTNRARYRIKDITSSQTLDPLDDTIHVDATTGNITITIYSASGEEGGHHFIKRVDSVIANNVTFQMTGSETIDFETLYMLVNQGSGAHIYAHNGNWFIRHT